MPPRKSLADFSGLCQGKSHPLWKVIFGPIILLWNALKLFFFPCISVYVERLSRTLRNYACWVCFKFGFFSLEYRDWNFHGDAAHEKTVEAKCDWIKSDQLDVAKKSLELKEQMRLFKDKIEPTDVHKGGATHTWLASAFACLAEHPGAVRNCFRNTEYSDRGKYRINLYNGHACAWEVITVDDYFPVKAGTGEPMYMSPSENELWVILLEKAVAKYMGGYHPSRINKSGIAPSWAFEALTGNKVVRYRADKGTARHGNARWVVSDMRYVVRNGEHALGDIAYDEAIERVEDDALFTALEAFSASGAILACKGSGGHRDANLEMNMWYSIVQVRRAGSVMGEGGLKMVQLRDPWRFNEWNGPWSDKSKEWAQNPKVAVELKHTDDASDGKFWMRFSDFVRYFSLVDVCNRSTDRDLRLDIHEDMGMCGPAYGCAEGCLDFWFRCYGAKKILLGHEGESRPKAKKSKSLADFSGLCEGKAHPLWSCLFGPFILLWNSITTYFIPAVSTYLNRFFGALKDKLCFVCISAGWYYYRDYEFHGAVAHGDSEEGSAKEQEAKCDWIKADQLDVAKKALKHGDKMRLFKNEIEPADLVQGNLGDCWLVGALACLAEHPGAVRNCFRNTEYSDRGKYRINLYNGHACAWEVITVDDYFPVKAGTGKPMYMSPNENELWAILLEKAVAKFMGGYSSLDGGSASWAFTALTGDKSFFFRSEDLGWRLHDMRFVVRGGKHVIGDVVYDEAVNCIGEEDFFATLDSYHTTGGTLAASIKKNVDNVGDDGLVAHHLYSILQVRRPGSVMGKGGLKMIQLRNPWGKFEWNGAWSDGSKEWAQNPIISQDLKYASDASDGKFWMTYADFKSKFTIVHVCERSTKRDLRLDIHEDMGMAGPAYGCATGCYDFWFRCHGVQKIIMGKDSLKTLSRLSSSPSPRM